MSLYYHILLAMLWVGSLLLLSFLFIDGRKLFFARTKLLSSSHRGHKWQRWDFQTIRGTPLALALIHKACMGPELICVDSRGRGRNSHYKSWTYSCCVLFCVYVVAVS